MEALPPPRELALREYSRDTYWVATFFWRRLPVSELPQMLIMLGFSKGTCFHYKYVPTAVGVGGGGYQILGFFGKFRLPEGRFAAS